MTKRFARDPCLHGRRAQRSTSASQEDQCMGASLKGHEGVSTAVLPAVEEGEVKGLMVVGTGKPCNYSP